MMPRHNRFLMMGRSPAVRTQAEEDACRYFPP